MVATVATTDRKVLPASVPQLRQRRRQEQQRRIPKSTTLLLRRQTKCKDDGFDSHDLCKYTTSRAWNNHNGRMILTMKNTSTPMSIIVLMQLLWMVTLQSSVVVVVDAANLGLAHAAAANGRDDDDDGSPAPVYFTVGLFLGIGVTACLMHYCYWRPKDRSRRNEWSLDGNSNDNKTVVGDDDEENDLEDSDMVMVNFEHTRNHPNGRVGRRSASMDGSSPPHRSTTITTLDVIPEGVHENPSLEIPSVVVNDDNNNDNGDIANQIATPIDDNHDMNIDGSVNAAANVEDVNQGGNNNDTDDGQ